MARGHLVQRAKGTWSIKLEIGADPETGRRRQKWLTIKGAKKQAEAELARLLVSLDQGSYIEPSKTTVSTFMDHWLRAYAETNTRPRTCEGYRDIVKRYIVPAIGSIPLSKLGPAHVQGLYSRLLAKGLSPRTVLSAHRVLREALGHAVRWNLVIRNICDQVDPPRPQRKEMEALDTEEASRLLDAAQRTPYGVLVALALHSGMRRGEMCGLRWRDVDLDLGYLSVAQTIQRIRGQGLQFFEPKTPRSRRRIALGPQMVALLRRHRARQGEERLRLGPVWQDRGLVFTRPDGRPLDPDELSHAFKRIVRSVGLPESFRLHDMRHTSATLLLKANVHPKVVSDRLGHSTVSITLDLYSHVVPALGEEAARTIERMMSEKMR